MMAKGTVKWFNEKKGFGFISDPEVKEDVFVHYSAIHAEGFRTLSQGDVVEYEQTGHPQGIRAKNVIRVKG